MIGLARAIGERLHAGPAVIPGAALGPCCRDTCCILPSEHDTLPFYNVYDLARLFATLDLS
jgi:hypothetical protein